MTAPKTPKAPKPARATCLSPMPHFCRIDHEPIRHADSSHELCPLCRMRYRAEEAAAEVRRLRRALRAVRRALLLDGFVAEDVAAQIDAALAKGRTR